MATASLTKQQLNDLKARAEVRIAELCGKHEIKRPDLRLDLRGMSAGQALLNQNVIRLNPLLFFDNQEHILNVTIPHELCHLWKVQLKKQGKPHGKEWQSLMRKMGVKPNRCHSLEVDHVRRRKTVYIAKCNCPGPGKHRIGPTKYKRIYEQGLTYICRICRVPILVVDVERPEDRKAA